MMLTTVFESRGNKVKKTILILLFANIFLFIPFKEIYAAEIFPQNGCEEYRDEIDSHPQYTENSTVKYYDDTYWNPVTPPCGGAYPVMDGCIQILVYQCYSGEEWTHHYAVTSQCPEGNFSIDDPCWGSSPPTPDSDDDGIPDKDDIDNKETKDNGFGAFCPTKR